MLRRGEVGLSNPFPLLASDGLSSLFCCMSWFHQANVEEPDVYLLSSATSLSLSVKRQSVAFPASFLQALRYPYRGMMCSRSCGRCPTSGWAAIDTRAMSTTCPSTLCNARCRACVLATYTHQKMGNQIWMRKWETQSDKMRLASFTTTRRVPADVVNDLLERRGVRYCLTVACRDMPNRLRQKVLCHSYPIGMLPLYLWFDELRSHLIVSYISICMYLIYNTYIYIYIGYRTRHVPLPVRV